MRMVPVKEVEARTVRKCAWFALQVGAIVLLAGVVPANDHYIHNGDPYHGAFIYIGRSSTVDLLDALFLIGLLLPGVVVLRRPRVTWCALWWPWAITTLVGYMVVSSVWSGSAHLFTGLVRHDWPFYLVVLAVVVLLAYLCVVMPLVLLVKTVADGEPTREQRLDLPNARLHRR